MLVVVVAVVGVHAFAAVVNAACTAVAIVFLFVVDVIVVGVVDLCCSSSVQSPK